MKSNKFNFARVQLQVILLVLIGVFMLALSLLGVGLGYAAMAQRQATDDAAHMSPVRELLVRAMEGTKSPAVIDPKTGDAYFPPTRYYLPAASTAGLTYAYDKDQGLTISSRQVLGQAVSSFYSALNINQLFAAVPHAQACQRGVLVATKQQQNDSLELKQTLSLNGGVYLYAEKACTQLSDVVTVLQGLQAY